MTSARSDQGCPSKLVLKPKLESKLVSALSETKRLFRLFSFYTKTESFDVLIEPKQTDYQLKEFDREHILLFFTENFGFFRFFRLSQKAHPNSLKESIFGYFSENLGLLRNSSVQLFRYRFETPKQTKTFCFWFHETNAKQILFRFVLVRTEIYFCVCFEDTLVRSELGPSVEGVGGKAVNREDKLSRRYRGRDLAKFERSRRYRER